MQGGGTLEILKNRKRPNPILGGIFFLRIIGKMGPLTDGTK